MAAKKKTAKKKASGLKSYTKAVFGSPKVKAAKKKIEAAEKNYKKLVTAAKKAAKKKRK